MNRSVQLLSLLFLGLGLGLGVSACKKDAQTQGAAAPAGETKPTGDQATAPSAAVPSASTAAKAGDKCTDGTTRCQGNYTGKVKPGNNAPAGAQVEVCKGGVWTVQEACDAAKNAGCYAIDDPASTTIVARCASAMATGE